MRAGHKSSTVACRERLATVTVALVLSFFLAAGVAARADSLDEVVTAEMQAHDIPGLSLAVIDKGEIAKAQGYGLIARTGEKPVTTATLFQAGSISKPVAALGALSLVEQNRLSLDEDVNTKLRTWKVPENEFTKEEKVTLRRLLSHSAGLTVHGFPGYAVGTRLPTLVQVLNGEAPANTAAIRPDLVPGSKLRYSGGGYTVMQQLIIDVSGNSFPDFMHEVVLKPLGMTNSTYEQGMHEPCASQTANGYYPKGKAVPGRWHLYPEMAAAGLWTTASDLARFAISIQQSLAGKSNPVISQAMTRQMLANQKEGAGLGLFLSGKGKKLRFSHNGRDEGFDAIMTAFAETGQGAVIMINANENSGSLNRIVEAIQKDYHWPDSP